jgi:hypothetical protein
MKTKAKFILLFVLTAVACRAQMNIGSSTPPNADAMLEISGNTTGLLLPRVALTSTVLAAPMSAHVVGMVVYNTASAGSGVTAVSPGYYYDSGVAWVRIAGVSSGSSWLTGGNLNGALSTIGTNDNYDLPFVTNGSEKMRILSTGQVGINTTTVDATNPEMLKINSGSSTSENAIGAYGAVNDFYQMNIQNTSLGANAQAGYSATANNGTNITSFVWMGINNTNFNFPAKYNIGVGDDASFLGSGNDLYIANANQSKSIIFSTGKNTTPFFNERMRITNAGRIGIGTGTPDTSALLELASASKGLLMPRVNLVSLSDANTIALPATSLLVYNTNAVLTGGKGFYYNTGTPGAVTWTKLATSAPDNWGLIGNQGTTAGTNFIGTTDNAALMFKVNNVQAGLLSPTNFSAFFGVGAGVANSGGMDNVAVGDSALRSNSSGNENTALGDQSLFLNTTGNDNSATGVQALYSNTVGVENTALGDQAMYSNVAGSRGVALGAQAMFYANNTSTPFTNYNLAIGYNALKGSSNAANNVGNYNTAVGYTSMSSMTSGVQNTALGYNALSSNSNGGYNTGIGASALGNNSNGNYNAALGFNALVSSNGSNNTAIGYNALVNNSNGSSNTAIGYNTGLGITTGSKNTIVGSNVTGLAANLNNVIILADGAGRKKVYIDSVGHAGINTTTFDAVNPEMLKINSGSSTSENAIGAYGAINDFYQMNIQNTSAGTNAQAGYSATANNGTNITSFVWMGINNTNFNNPTTYNIGSGNDASLLGSGNDLYIANGNQSKSIIFSTGTNATPFFNERMRILNNGNVGIGVATPSHPLEMGSGAFVTLGGNWVNASDSRLKKNIVNTPYGLAEVLKLRPVNYIMIRGEEAQVGFIAQEVRKIIPEVVFGNEGDLSKGETLGLSYGNLVAVLTKAIQEQQAMIVTQQKQIEAIQKDLEAFKSKK